MKLLHPTLRWTALAATTGFAFAQANDECVNAMPVTAGVHPFDTGTATLSMPTWGCAGTGGPDLWYEYTAGNSGTLTVSTCGSTYDTALEVFDGTCASLNQIGCNDDACTLQSSLTVATTPGSIYYIRVGGWNNSTGAGMLLVDDGTPRINPANGNHYLRVSQQGISWDQARIDAAATMFQGIQGHLAVITSQSENDFIYTLGVVHNYWIGGFQNTSSPTFSEPGGGWEWITGEPFVFTNWHANQPNNSGTTGAEDFLELLQTAALGDTWNDAAPFEHPRGYVIEYPTGTIGTNYCMANVNSTGTEGKIRASGSDVASANDVTLRAVDVPRFSFGFFITSQMQGFAANPNGSQGNLCLAGNIGRYVGPGQIQNSGSAGELELVLDLTQTPTPNGLFPVQAGETWNFSTWFRDSVGGVATSNFTDGVEIVFI